VSTIESRPLHRSLGLTDAEFERIRELLEREPNDFELAVFSLLWSEHCAYKHSRRLLAAFPTTGERVLQGPGENAGVIDVGDGLAVALKVESHNHPSAVEPFQGAATGVGGILRDIGTCSPASSRASATTATAWASRTWAARSSSSPPTSTTAS
jgi:phosphoribosylformylglycinamidine synthase